MWEEAKSGEVKSEERGATGRNGKGGERKKKIKKNIKIFLIV